MVYSVSIMSFSISRKFSHALCKTWRGFVVISIDAAPDPLSVLSRKALSAINLLELPAFTPPSNSRPQLSKSWR
jgi:hypothetical protein